MKEADIFSSGVAMMMGMIMRLSAGRDLMRP